MISKRPTTSIVPRGFIVAAAIAAALASPPQAPADGSSRNIVAGRRSAAITIDGVLSEQAWESAVPVGGFLQYDPAEGEPATEATTVRALFDDDNVYFAIFCRDSEPGLIDRQLTRRDRSGQSDRVSVIIDSYHAHTTAFLFSVSASGVQSDGVFSYDGLVYDVQWDAVWEAGAAVTPGGWGAELRIPFSALRFTLQEGEYVWGVNFRRYIARKNETDEWVMVPRNEVQPGVISSVSKMGHLSGLTNIAPPLHIEVLPYQVTSYGHFAEPAPFDARQELEGSFGLDAKYGVTNNVTLDLTVNPDFGQVEVDQAVLNLTVFDTYYPEKRPFFLEGASLFAFGNAFDNRDLGLFYSRRIGRAPTLARPPTPGTVYEENPRVTTILGAAKLTGRSEGGLTYGALTALTDEEVAVERDASGNTLDPFVIEPRAGYGVVRLAQDVGTSSRIGVLGTIAGKDARSPAWSGGADWRLRFDDDAILADGYIAYSKPSVESGIAGRAGGSAGRIALGSIGDDHLIGFSTYDYSSRNFSVDDLGFYEQPREHGGYTQGTWRENDAGDGAVRRYAVTLQPNYRWNWDGFPTLTSLEFEPAFEFTNFWTLTLNVNHGFRAYDDASRGINGLYLRPEITVVRAVVDTDPSRNVVASGYFGFDDDALEMQRLIASLKVTLRVTGWMELVPMVTVAKTWHEEAWAIPFYEASGNNLFGDRDVDQLDFSLRGTVAFSRKVTAQFFTQVFIAKGVYRNFRELTGPESFVPVAFDPASGTPDFDDRVLNANFVLRWEYLPGSTIYLVWTHERAGSVTPSNGSVADDVAETFKLPVNNVFLAKISYWWSL